MCKILQTLFILDSVQIDPTYSSDCVNIVSASILSFACVHRVSC